MTTTAAQITRTTDAGEVTYSLTIDGAVASFLVIDAETRMVWNVETVAAHLGEGFARTLWEAANAEAECYHALDHHRTAEGDAFAQAVGGETIDETTGYVAECCICNSADDDTDY